ncbi:sororin [Cottoperca gobio]|uniref:Sororin n=1 Tax=Cottoperca gobio TaxID=56716 RepID=A0A6J2QMH1_COTGO|nr:sororin [Cottoperca gobio]
MNEGTPKNVMAESNNLNGSQRRRSPRLSSPPANVKVNTDNKMAIAVKRSITVRKIAPRKTVAPSEHNKENTPSQPKISTPGPVPGRGGSSSVKKKQKATILSPILASSPPAPSRPQQPAAAPEEAVWSQKVRRSYSRLSDKSFNSPDSRENLFGFDKMNTPEVMRRVVQSKKGLEASLSGLNSFTSLLEAGGCGLASPEKDLNIPGVAMVKEKKRRRKVQQIGSTELEALAAQMNAEFDEAEEFELLVE